MCLKTYRANIMKIAALFSGGKDSLFALYIAHQYGWDITHLITINPKNKESWMYHSVNIHLTKTIAEALEIPFISKTTEGEKETELDALKHLLSSLEIDGVISGAIASEYQRTRIEQVCYDLNLKSFTPLWHKNQALLLQDMIQAGFDIRIVGIFADGFDKTWLGKTIDQDTFEQLIRLHQSKQINIAGEGGEYETLGVNGPLFHKRIELIETEKQWKRDHGILLVKKIALKEK